MINIVLGVVLAPLSFEQIFNGNYDMMLIFMHEIRILQLMMESFAYPGIKGSGRNLRIKGYRRKKKDVLRNGE